MAPLTQGREGRCDYNVRWMDATFRSRKNSESLLTPELENGNLTRRDYEALMAALPGAQYSDLAGFGIGGLGTLLYSRFKPMKVSVGLIGYLAGTTLSKALRLYTHTSYFRSIENLNGFARAMDNVKRKVGFSPGLISLSKPLPYAAEGDQPPFQQEADTPYGEAAPAPAPSAAAPAAAPATPTPQAPAAAKSRWDEIRAARHADGPSKAWENIRQGRKPDGTPMPKQLAASESEPQGGQSWESTFRDNDRAAEQASFNAMLDRERNMGSSS
ncbi:hypothetical protein C8R44DRAFT_883941 [Mycena epipterygia]|nr:hypothetical protein C8R44DRAFT_883941 [Mycena epipterygia]